MAEGYLSMQDLSVGYNGNAIIRDICIDIQKGEIVTLIGPNGAGKSTILKSITRQLQMIKGGVIFDGDNLSSMSFKKLSTKMAVVLTERLKTELMTCHDIVATGRYPYTGRFGILSAEDEEKVDAALRRVNAIELGSKDFNAISDGQRQRVLLARAICQEPEIIILDEPTSFLDIRYKLELLSILRSMAKENNITVIMSLHEIDLAEKMADKIICVKGDRIAHYGRPEDIFEEETIRDLYSIDNGFFDPLFGSIELPRPEGQPRAFVISSGGSGMKTYRRLQKADIPFAAGILYENDIDFQLARLLAVEVVSEKNLFSDITDETYKRAAKLVSQVETVYNCGVTIGTCNRRIQDLLDQARKEGKLTEA